MPLLDTIKSTVNTTLQAGIAGVAGLTSIFSVFSGKPAETPQPVQKTQDDVTAIVKAGTDSLDEIATTFSNLFGHAP